MSAECRVMNDELKTRCLNSSFSTLHSALALLLLPNQRHRLGARARVFAEAAADGGGDCDCAGLLHAADGHAGVLGLHDDHYADRLESVEECVGDLGGQALLDL